MPFVKMKKTGSYRGREYAEGVILSVGDDLADKMILAGRCSVSTEELYKEQEAKSKEVNYKEMTLAQLGEVEYKELNQDSLAQYALACGIEIDGKNKKEIIALIAKIDFSNKSE